MQEATAASSTFAVPEPDLTPREIVARAAAMRPELLERQPETEEQTFYAQDTTARSRRRASTGSSSRGASAATSSTSRPTSA